MLRVLCRRGCTIVRTAAQNNANTVASAQCVRGMSAQPHIFNPAALGHPGMNLELEHEHPGDALDARFITYLQRSDIDGWEIRKAINDLQGHDMVPDPKIVTAAMQACRRVNDFALAVRFLEAIQFKCGKQKNEIWPYMLQEIGPTLTELGIATPEEMGYDKPELALQSVWDM